MSGARMNGPPKRNGPESATNTHPGHNPSLVKVRVHNDYSEAGEIATAAKAEADLPDFETGWSPYIEDGEPAGYVAFLRPWHENWYDLYHFWNWVDAISCALALTNTRPGCVYVGGPGHDA